jgi:hypothetical protein
MKTVCSIPLLVLSMILILEPFRVSAQEKDSPAANIPSWYLSVQYLGLTYHPDGGNTPEIYPLKLDKKAFLVLDVGVVANVDYRLNNYSFLRFTSAMYKDCAFVTAGCLHFGPRLQYSWGSNSVNVGIGPIFSFREDWHRFKEYTDDEFYGNRVYNGWQYRFFPTAVEFEYLCRIDDSTELQYSLIPGAPLVITSLLGVRFGL